MTNGDRFQRWMSSGFLATVAWFLLLVLYSVFKALKIDAPALDTSFQLLTGGWVAMLTLAQSKKNAKTEEKAEEARETANDASARADKAEKTVKKLKKVAVDKHPETEDELDD